MVNNHKNNNASPRLYDVEAEVHKAVNEGFRVKVLVASQGIYINGMMVFRPNEEHDEWAVYPPAKRAGRGKYIYIVEFDKGTSFWSEVYDACIKAVEDYSHVNVTKSFSAPRKLDEVVEVDLDAPINLDDIPSF